MSRVVTSIKALIFKDDKFLLLKESIRKKEIWDLPGGKIEYGETPQEALKREVKEELWIDVEVGKSVGVWWFYSAHNQYQVICHTFLCTPPEKFEIDFSHNPAEEYFVDHKWVTPAEVINGDSINISESLKNLLANL
ncbi:MAG: NUDIX hydrolase [Patescibacteria group bacterium]